MAQPRATSSEAQLAGYFARYEPAVARMGKALRAKLRKRLPGLHEIVYLYENQGVLLIAYSPTEKGYEGLCSLGLYPGEVKLSFGQGAQLSKADPSKLLKGTGKTVRHVVLESAADLARPEVEALIAAALKLANVRIDLRAKGSTIVKADAQKARAGRDRKASAPRTSRRK